MNKICIFGVGLIGGSLALALKQHNYCDEIVGCNRSEANLKKAAELGVIDSWSTDPAKAVKDADIVFIATPVGVMESVVASFRDQITDQMIITDAGSCKVSVIDSVRRAIGHVPDNFVPGHPIAGREKSGVEAADGTLYVDHKVILTPLDNTNSDAVETVAHMWRTCGANVQLLDAGQHDQVLAATSHLPHVLAYALVQTVAQTSYVGEIFEFAAGGFRDSSRVASSDPTMWRDICMDNREAILEMTSLYREKLDELDRLIESGESDKLFDLFKSSKQVRDQRFG